MSDASTQELIGELRRSVRRWKTLALILMVGLDLVLAVGVGATIVQVQGASAARDAELAARQQAEQARDEAERNRQTAEAFRGDGPEQIRPLACISLVALKRRTSARPENEYPVRSMMRTTEEYLDDIFVYTRAPLAPR